MMKSGFYTTTSNDQLSGWTEKKLQVLPKAKFAPKLKKAIVTFWWSAAHLTHYSFLSPSETITLISMLSELMKCTKNCNAGCCCCC